MPTGRRQQTCPTASTEWLTNPASAQTAPSAQGVFLAGELCRTLHLVPHTTDFRSLSSCRSQGRLYQHVAASIGANSHFKANYDLSKIKIFGQTAFGASMIDIPGGRRLLGGVASNAPAQCAGHREGGSVDSTGDTAVLTIPMAGGLECKACLNFKVNVARPFLSLVTLTGRN